MATKKQKHEAALRRRERRQAELERSNLEAQRIDHELRERRTQAIADAAIEKDKRDTARIAAHLIKMKEQSNGRE